MHKCIRGKEKGQTRQRILPGERNHMERDGQDRQMKTAIILARMYGIFETLHPVAFRENEAVVALMEQWAEEYLHEEYLHIEKETGKEPDLTKFFEEKSRTIS